MNNTAFWMALALAAILSAVATWGITKSYYSSTSPATDTAHVHITPYQPPTIEAPPTTYIQWHTKTVHDTLRDTVSVYPQLDTTLVVAMELEVDSLPPDTISVESQVSIAYNHDLNLFRFTRTIPTITLDLPVRIDTRTVMVTRDPLFWWQTSMLWQGNNPGVGIAVGITRYSLGRKWVWGREPLWEFGVRFGI